MEAFPLTALDLPLKLLVWEDGAVVNVAYTPASEIASRYGVPANDQAHRRNGSRPQRHYPIQSYSGLALSS